MTRFTSDRAFAVLCCLVVSFNFLFTAICAIPVLANVPGNKGLWLICVLNLLVAGLWQDFRNGRRNKTCEDIRIAQRLLYL